MNRDPQLALESLWQSLHADLRAFFVRRLPSESLADDMTQETFLRLKLHEQKLDEIERIESWVFRIARNLLVDFYRRENNSPIKFAESQIDSAATELESSENHNQHLGRWLREAIGKLPDSMREAMRMYEFDAMNQQEIADALGISLSAAKSRIQRGRGKLKELLKQCCALEMDVHGNIVDYRQVGIDCNSEHCN